MGKWWEHIAEYDAESTTWTACAGTISGASSPYTPLKSSRIKLLRVSIEGGVVTNLIDAVQFKLKSAAWPIDCVVGNDGGGLRTTLPAVVPHRDHEVDLPVSAGVPITIEGRNVSAQTPVTVRADLYAQFEG